MPTLAGHTRNAIQATRSVINNPGIAQDNIIFAMLLFGFVVWITTKGELPTYLAFFKPGSAGIPSVPVAASSTTGAATPQSVTQAVGGTIANVPSQVTGILSGTASGIGNTIYNAVIGQPLKLIQGFGHSIGIPGL